MSDTAAPEILAAGLQPGDLLTKLTGNPPGNLIGDPALLDDVAAVGRANISVKRDGNAMLPERVVA